MILSTHAIVGGAIASLIPSHPVLVAMAGFASHFALDAIPHWDYPLRAISIGRNADNRDLRLDSRLMFDLMVISFDACAGLAIAVWLFAAPASIGAVLLGSSMALSPDALQFAYSLYPHEPLKSVQQFHQRIHSKRELSWPVGATSQAVFAAAVSAVAIALS